MENTVRQRNTVQQSIIRDALNRLANHPTADCVYEEIHAEHPSISKATVYRTLNKLAENGQASKVRLNNSADCFDHRTDRHYHVRCSVCGRVDDVFLPLFSSSERDAAEQTDYLISGHELQFDGVCPACQQALQANGESNSTK